MIKVIFLSMLLFVCCSCEQEETDSQIRYRIDIRKKNTIKTELGTELVLEPGFIDYQGNTVEIVVDEYYDIPSMIMMGLPTVSSDGILESSGMINIQLFDGNELLGLEIDISKCELKMPKPIKPGYYGLYLGEANENGVTQWIKDTNRINLNREPLIGVGETQDGDRIYIEGDEIYPILYNLGQFNWINADRLLEFKNAEDLIVSSDYLTDKANYMLVFENYNSLIDGFKNIDGDLVFSNIPKDEGVYIVTQVPIDEGTKFNLTYVGTQRQNVRLGTPILKSKEEIRRKLENVFGNSLARR